MQETNPLPLIEDFNRVSHNCQHYCGMKNWETLLVLSSPCHYLHMASFMSDHKGRGEAVLVVQSAAPQRVAHACHWSVTWATEKTTQL